jgi:phosphoserine aminotransferase
MWNTPPCFSIYLMGLVLKWLQRDIGGLAKMHELNKQKAKMLYDVVDASNGFYQGHAQPEDRSTMNVTFRLKSPELEKAFVSEAAKQDLHTLKGHRSVGGMRASIYNAMPIEGVTKLRDFMKEFAAKNS